MRRDGCCVEGETCTTARSASAAKNILHSSPQTPLPSSSFHLHEHATDCSIWRGSPFARKLHKPLCMHKMISCPRLRTTYTSRPPPMHRAVHSLRCIMRRYETITTGIGNESSLATLGCMAIPHMRDHVPRVPGRYYTAAPRFNLP